MIKTLSKLFNKIVLYIIKYIIQFILRFDNQKFIEEIIFKYKYN